MGGKYLRQGLSGTKPAHAPTGSGKSNPATFPGPPGADSKPAATCRPAWSPSRRANRQVWRIHCCWLLGWNDLDGNHLPRDTFARGYPAGCFRSTGRPALTASAARIKGRFRNLPLRAPLPHTASARPPSVDHPTPHDSPSFTSGLKSKPRGDLSQASRGDKTHVAGRLPALRLSSRVTRANYRPGRMMRRTHARLWTESPPLVDQRTAYKNQRRSSLRNLSAGPGTTPEIFGFDPLFHGHF
jgi:hypothetical protein